MSSSYQVGQKVWVEIAPDNEQLGSVVKLGCAQQQVHTIGRKKVGASAETFIQDGIMVKLHAGNTKSIYDPSQLRPFTEEATKRAARSNTVGAPKSAAKATKKSRRAAITPSPNQAAVHDLDKKPAAKQVSEPKKKQPAIKKGATVTKRAVKPSDDAGYDDDDDSSEQPVAKKGTTASKHFSKPSDNTDEEESSDFSFEVGHAVAAKTTKSAKGRTKTKSKSSETTAPVQKKQRAKVIVLSDDEDDDRSDAANASGNTENSDDNDDSNLDRPFMVDYAPTSRATCRRCDQIITKGECRISHIPLFRGKPGFRIYRHLQCSIFDENIHCVQDIGGWKRLKTCDLENLALQVETSKIELEQENREISPDELVQVAFAGEIRGPPKGLSANLLPFQVEGASWMYHQEVKCDELHGGILADEMGMGKTIQTIATILDNRPKLQHSKPGAKHPPGSLDIEDRLREDKLWSEAVADWNHELKMNNIPKSRQPKKHSATRAGTLVICPVIALSQWKSEIEKFSEPGELKVGIYHGPTRTSDMPLDMICKYDVVLTTYQVIETDFRKMVSPNKVSCPNCGAKFKIDKLHVHLKYFCGESAQRTEAQARQRRNNDAPASGRPGSSGSQNKSKSTKKKPPMTKMSASNKESPEKSRVRVKSQGDYDSDSELSIESYANLNSKRPSRSAATLASKRMKASASEWNAAAAIRGNDEDDESAYGSDSTSDSDTDDNVGGGIIKSKGSTLKKVAGSRQKKLNTERNDSSDSDSEDAFDKVRARQKQALEKYSKNTKHLTSKKPASKKVAPKKKGKGKKKFKDEGSSSSSDSSDDEVRDDPMANIDLDDLVNEAMAGAAFSPLHAFVWWRIVLDEAHYIKSRSSQTSASAFSLTGIHRWCLSGTPLQNRVGELYSLIRFLRLDPMAHYCCRQKGCSCKSLHYRIKAGKCQDCGHRAFTHYSHFNRYVLNPIQREGYTGDGRRAMFKLKEEVLDKSLLRRTKETRAADMNLPPRIVKIRSVRLHPIEQDFYNALYTQTKSSFDDYVAEGTLLNNYAHIFDLLTRLRQAVDHPYLIVYSHRSMKLNQGIQQRQKAAVANGSVECTICDEPFTERVVSSCCGAGFCRACVIEYLSGAGEDSTSCPSCEQPFTIDLNQKSVDVTDDDTLAAPSRSSPNDPTLKELLHVATGSILRRINLAEFATSSKIEVLVQELVEMRKKRPGSKALVFSQFVNMLDLIRWRLHADPYLQELGLGVRILHGGMDVKSRNEALKDFREDSGCRVLLMSLKAAGVALNLTVASECYLMDLWWNPAAEMQAIDRCHRLGQFRPIRAVRLVAEGTVEERVLQLQEKKRLVFNGTVGRDAASLKMLNVNDMVNLFSSG